jgi:hypothetical protein
MDLQEAIAQMDAAQLKELRRLIAAREAELRLAAGVPLRVKWRTRPTGEGHTWLEVGDVAEEPGPEGMRLVWQPLPERYPQADKRLQVKSYALPERNEILWEIEVPVDYPHYLYQIAGDEHARNRVVFRPAHRRQDPDDLGAGVVG